MTPAELGLSAELPGRVEASRVAQVRARAAGILQQRLFREGSEVKAGQALFTIDASPYQAAFDSAQASLAKAEANLAQARALAERYQPLAEARAISQQEFVNAQAAHRQAQADVAVAKAALQTMLLALAAEREPLVQTAGLVAPCLSAVSTAAQIVEAVTASILRTLSQAAHPETHLAVALLALHKP